MNTPAMLLTARMRLVPATVELAQAEIEDRAALATLLQASIPVSWPPEMLADALPFFLRQLEASPHHVGWITWYGVLRDSGSEPDTLVASSGFMGPPQDGTVEIGYSVLPEYQRQGLATEMVEGLVGWALAHAAVRRVVAEIHSDNTPSLQLVCKLGFAEIGAGSEPGYLRFELGGATNGRT
ncbi:MAG: GNAT family N-acetyltransferase [Herpetosiphonaceae bacterium]|nr:GNAT family N-acetyltransferase [Herpetosiphonaceae bacterium]